jgi:hypothetical protein
VLSEASFSDDNLSYRSQFSINCYFSYYLVLPHFSYSQFRSIVTGASSAHVSNFRSSAFCEPVQRRTSHLFRESTDNLHKLFWQSSSPFIAVIIGNLFFLFILTLFGSTSQPLALLEIASRISSDHVSVDGATPHEHVRLTAAVVRKFLLFPYSFFASTTDSEIPVLCKLSASLYTSDTACALLDRISHMLICLCS